jgi:riboflavin biosynthesis pyrimidine reductase
MLPNIVLHTATSPDGRITNFPADIELYYGLAAQWNPDAILFGSETVLEAVRDNPALEVPRSKTSCSRPRKALPIHDRCSL